ncbi:putative iron-regulated protein [Elusimicrobium posterum]|uniref:ChaN family lipoprotein n=1 Tax=Elusimicrobium posterum TaxID=3116653 RepID=UPI003C732DAE
MKIKILFILSLLAFSLTSFAQETKDISAVYKQKMDALHEAVSSDKAFHLSLVKNAVVVGPEFDFSTLLKNTDILFLGEFHADPRTAREVNLIIKSAAGSQKTKPTHLASEFLIIEDQPLVDSYEEGKISYEDLKKSLYPVSMAENVLVAARYALKSVALDTKYAKDNSGWAISASGITKRNAAWAEIINNIFTLNKNAKVIVYAGGWHTAYDMGNAKTLPQYFSAENKKYKVLEFMGNCATDYAWCSLVNSLELQNKFVLFTIPSKYRKYTNADYIYYIPKHTSSNKEEQEKTKTFFKQFKEGQLDKLLKNCQTDPDNPICKHFNELQKNR